MKQAKAYGLKTFYPGQVYVDPWMMAGDPGAYVDWAMAMLQHWRAQGGGRLRGVVRPVRSSASGRWRSLTPIAPRVGMFTATLPPQSVTTFVATR